MNRIYPYTYQEEIPTPNKPSEIITFWVDEAGNKYIQKLQQENKQLKEKIDILLEDNNQLEEIRIKVIKYIKANTKNDTFCEWYDGEVKDLLEILGDKEC